MISIEIISTPDRPLVKVAGHLDVQSAAEFEAAVLPVAEKSDQTPVLDFAGIEYISSMGLRSLALAAKAAAKKGGTLRIIGVRPEVFSILKRCGFETFMDIERHAQ